MSMYCRREEAEFYGSFDENDITIKGMTYDEAVNWIIIRATAKIDNHLKVPEGFFVPGGVEIHNEYHNGADLKYVGYDYMFSTVTGINQAAAILHPNHKPILSVRLLEENTSGSTWTTRTEGRNNDYLVTKDFIVFIQNIPDWDYKNIRVTYLAGYRQTPLVITDACARLAAYMMQRIEDASKRESASVGGLNVTQTGPDLNNLLKDFMPDDIKRDLQGLAPKRYECF